MRIIYLALALWGAVHPMWYFIQWFRAEGLNLAVMVDAWTMNTATIGLVWDLTIAATVLSVWIIFEVYKSRQYWHSIAILATFGIGLSCGLPLYLFLRSQIGKN
jgi:hypothetical protein